LEAKQILKNIFLNNTTLPIICINTQGQVVHWSKGAEKLFGYTHEEVNDQEKNFLTKDNEKELILILEKAVQKENFMYKLQHTHKKGYAINVLVNTTAIINDEGSFTGVLAILQNTSAIKKAITLGPVDKQKETKRTFKVIRNTILTCLTKGKMTINQISNSTGINWKTVEKHLTYLIGKKMIDEVFSSEYVRIFELVERGREYVKELQKERLTDYFKFDEVKE